MAAVKYATVGIDLIEVVGDVASVTTNATYDTVAFSERAARAG